MPAGINTSSITTYTFTKNKGSCDSTKTCTEFLNSKPAYEKEFYFFDDFVVASGCGTITYKLIDGDTNADIASNVAIIDTITEVPGRRRIFLKDASAVVNKKFKVKATN